MKLTSKYNIIRQAKYYLLGLALAGAVAGCEKDPVTPEPTPTPTPTPTTQKHNVELVYYDIEQDMPMDTLYKYNAAPTVDTIFMVPEMSNQFSTLPTSALKTVISLLRERKNVNPDKVFGKGELMLKSSSVGNNPEIVRFFADTLKYTITYNDQVKGR